MKDFNIDLDEILRYLVVGGFFMILNFVAIESNYLNSKIAIIDKQNLFSVFASAGLVAGVLIYTIYRAIFFPLLLNPLTTFIFLKFNPQKGLNAKQYIFETDKKRWKIQLSARKSLSEWASQIHLLNNLAASLFITQIIVSKTKHYYQSNVFLLIGILILIVAIYHHYRYKIYENMFLKESINNSPNIS